MEGSSGLANFFGGDRDRHAKFLEADRALVLVVKGSPFVVSGGQVQDFEGQQFQGAEKFATAIKEQSGVGTGEVDEDFGLPVSLRGGSTTIRYLR